MTATQRALTPTEDDEAAADEVADRWIAPHGPQWLRDKLAASIAQALAAKGARQREADAKIAETLCYDIKCRQGERPLIVDTAIIIAAAIRSQP